MSSVSMTRLGQTVPNPAFLVGFMRGWCMLRHQGIRVSQHPDELAWLGAQLHRQKCRSLLEVGSKFGGSLYLLAKALPHGAKVVAVDLPGGRWGVCNSAQRLQAIARKLRYEGYDMNVILQDSHAPQTIEAVMDAFPDGIDCAFVDGDHSYQGVSKDFLNFFPLVRGGGIVAFHDVWPRRNEPEIEVPRLWLQLTQHYRCDLFVAKYDSPGIGVIHKDYVG